MSTKKPQHAATLEVFSVLSKFHNPNYEGSTLTVAQELDDVLAKHHMDSTVIAQYPEIAKTHLHFLSLLAYNSPHTALMLIENGAMNGKFGQILPVYKAHEGGATLLDYVNHLIDDFTHDATLNILKRIKTTIETPTLATLEVFSVLSKFHNPNYEGSTLEVAQELDAVLAKHHMDSTVIAQYPEIAKTHLHFLSLLAYNSPHTALMLIENGAMNGKFGKELPVYKIHEGGATLLDYVNHLIDDFSSHNAALDTIKEYLVLHAVPVVAEEEVALAAEVAPTDDLA